MSQNLLGGAPHHDPSEAGAAMGAEHDQFCFPFAGSSHDLSTGVPFVQELPWRGCAARAFDRRREKGMALTLQIREENGRGDAGLRRVGKSRVHDVNQRDLGPERRRQGNPDIHRVRAQRALVQSDHDTTEGHFFVSFAERGYMDAAPRHLSSATFTGSLTPNEHNIA
jgi:hypothetical protein